MSNFREVTFGEHVFSHIDENQYLQKLYNGILFNYSRRLFQLNELKDQEINLHDALTFADILSKSYGTSLADVHKTRAQEMVALLYDMYQGTEEAEEIRYYLGSVLANTGNYLGMGRLTPDFKNPTFLENAFMYYNMKSLRIPTEASGRFFPAQKEIYDNLGRDYFSYSAPTSMGKTFMMRVFIKQQIMKGVQKNFALLIPTKALINEIYGELVDELKSLLKEHNYRIVTSAGSIALEQKHNYIFVLTPERMLYILNDDPDLKLDYVFVDEAHKISSDDKRSSFYYMVIEKLEERESHPHIIFASPYIPNPDVYLGILENGQQYNPDNQIACSYAPVSQLKYIVDLWERNIRIFDSYSKKFIKLCDMDREYSLSEIISRIGDRRHNIVYCKSKNDAIQFARDYVSEMEIPDSTDKKLLDLAEAIKKDVHKQYYLADLVRKGVAYHIGYLPSNIRLQLEDYYREGLIKTMFCTSTLLEGVNLPAENLFITSYKKGLSKFSEVDFKNLMGRVGRAKYNLYGNVFVVRLKSQDNDSDLQKYEELLSSDVPPQKLSIETELNSNQKQLIVDTLCSGEVEIPRSKKDQSDDNYDLMRKTMLILAGDIAHGRRNARVFREFLAGGYLNQQQITLIKENFSAPDKIPDDDINVSYDQLEGLRKLVRSGACYPKIDKESREANYYETRDFLIALAKAFKWRSYERGTLGAFKDGEYTKLNWYSVLLNKWISGHGLNYIMTETIKDYDKYKRKVWINNHEWETYDRSRRHDNFIIANSLEAIEDVLLFRLSNYFLRFSEEWKNQHPDEDLTNDWHEFIEYGTSNKIRIILQRSGYKRESAYYIRQHADKYIRGPADNPKLLLKALLESPNELVRIDTEEIRYNVPELFIEDGEI
jgi:hypothetical protein